MGLVTCQERRRLVFWITGLGLRFSIQGIGFWSCGGMDCLEVCKNNLRLLPYSVAL